MVEEFSEIGSWRAKEHQDFKKNGEGSEEKKSRIRVRGSTAMRRRLEKLRICGRPHFEIGARGKVKVELRTLGREPVHDRT